MTGRNEGGRPEFQVRLIRELPRCDVATLDTRVSSVVKGDIEEGILATARILVLQSSYQVYPAVVRSSA